MANLQTIVKLVYRFLFWQIRSLFYALDPLAQYKPNPLFSNSLHHAGHRFYTSPFFAPLLLYIASDLYGNVFLVYNWQTFSKEVHYKNLAAAFKNCPVLMNHQVFPKVIHSQTDTAMIIGTLSSILAIGTFINTPNSFLDRYNLIKKDNDKILKIKGKNLPLTLSSTMLAVHQKSRRTFLIFLKVVTGTCLSFSYINVYLNDVYEVNLEGAFLWLIVFPVHILLTIYGLFGIVIFIVLGCQFLTQQQQYLLKRIETLNNHLLNLNYRKRGSKLVKTYYQFCSLNNRLVKLCVHIKRYSSFWSAPVTVYLSGVITMQCYLAHITIFADDCFPLIARLYFAYALFDVEVIQYALLYQCAKVAKLNGKAEAANRKFYLNFIKMDGFKLVNEKTAILKVELLQLNGRLKPFAMVLLDNYRITVKTFYLSISYTTIFFLIVVKNNR